MQRRRGKAAVRVTKTSHKCISLPAPLIFLSVSSASIGICRHHRYCAAIFISGNNSPFHAPSAHFRNEFDETEAVVSVRQAQNPSVSGQWAKASGGCEGIRNCTVDVVNDNQTEIKALRRNFVQSY